MTPLRDGDVHVFVAKLPDNPEPRACRLHPLLDAEERAALTRFAMAHARHSYLWAHALCRLALSRYADVTPVSWRFVRSPKGKPCVQQRLDAPLHFNISHTRSLVACAVARAPVGVDVETTTRHAAVQMLIDKVLTPSEAAAAKDASGLKAYFLQRWCLKEAYLKARGVGIGYGPQNVETDVDAAGAPCVRDVRDPSLTVGAVCLSLAAPHLGAVVVLSPQAPRVTCYDDVL